MAENRLLLHGILALGLSRPRRHPCRRATPRRAAQSAGRCSSAASGRFPAPCRWRSARRPASATASSSCSASPNCAPCRSSTGRKRRRSTPRLPISRVAAILVDGGDPLDFMASLFSAFWAEDRNIADEAVIAALLEQHGLDPAAVMARARQRRGGRAAAREYAGRDRRRRHRRAGLCPQRRGVLGPGPHRPARPRAVDRPRALQAPVSKRRAGWTSSGAPTTKLTKVYFPVSGETAMLSHETVWAAIDALAARYSLSASGLARRAGLDFDRLQQIQAALGRRPAALALDRVDRQDHRGDRFVGRRVPRPDPERRAPRADDRLPVQRASVPMLGFAQAGAGGFFDDAGFPAGHGWDLVELPARDARRCLCAAGAGRFHAAALPRRRRADRRADGSGQARRPRRGQDDGRRGHGQGADAPHGREARAVVDQSGPSDAHHRRGEIWNGSPASYGRASRRQCAR